MRAANVPDGPRDRNSRPPLNLARRRARGHAGGSEIYAWATVTMAGPAAEAIPLTARGSTLFFAGVIS